MKKQKNIHPEVKKLYDNIRKHSDELTAERIAHCIPLSESASKQDEARWVKSVTTALEEEFDEKTIIQIRKACYCTQASKLEETKIWIGEIYKNSKDMPDFVDKMNAKGAGWRLEGEVLYTIFTYCGCPLLEAVESLPSKTWCYCTAGYSKALFEHIFGYEINVKLVKSIKTGDDVCVMKISKKL